MSQILFPDSPTPGDSFVAPSGVTYTYDEPFGPGVEGVWLAGAATPTTPLTITNPGAISGSPQVNATLTYTPGTATGGVGAISYSWQWFITPSTLIAGSTDQATITVPAGALGQNIYVKLTATDSDTPTANIATADTANFPSSGTIAAAGITGAAAPASIPGTASFTWNDGNQNLSATGCLEFSVNGGVSFTQASTPVGNGTTVITQWKDVAGSGTCGDAPQGTTITGTLTDGTLTSTFNFQINRIPNSFSLSPNTENTTPLTTTVNDPSFTLGGCNTAPLVWGVLTGGGTNPQFSIDGGTTWVNLPSVPTSGINVPVGVATIVRFTTSSANGTETLDVFAGASTTIGEYHSALFTVTVAAAPFPGLSFNPVGGPNAAPASVNVGSLRGTATATWPATPSPASLTVTGAIQIEINNSGTFLGAGGPYTINNAESLKVIWDPGAVAGAVDGDTLNGSITNGTYTNTFQLIVDMDPDPFAADPFGNLDPVGLSSTNVSSTVTPTGFNVPIPLDVTAFATDGMGTPEAAVGPGGFAATPQTVDPGEGIQLRGIAGPTNSTVYGVDVSLGAPAQTTTWTTKTTGVTPTVDQPNIVTPNAGQTGVGTPSGITITSSAYADSPVGSTGGHDSSDWELYANGLPSSVQSTNTISAVAAAAVPTVGSVYGGGYFAGQVSTAGNGVADYNLVVAPVEGNTSGPATGGALKGQYGGTSPSAIDYKNSNSGDTNPPSQNVVYGAPATATFGALGAGTYPLFGWAYSAPSGPNAGTYDATNATGTGIGGYNDWYIPAKNELAILYFFLKPDTTLNNTSSGSNPNSVAPYTPGTNYSGGFPPTTSSALFQSGGGQEFSSVGYWSSSEISGSTSSAWSQVFTNGNQVGATKLGGSRFARAIRRVPTTGIGSTQTLSIAGADTDGFTVGMAIKGSSSGATGIITAINGTSVTITQTSATNWTTSDKIEGNGTLAASATNDTINKVSWPVAKPPLAANTTYYARVRYNSVNNPPVYTSAWSPWREFTTGSLLPSTVTLLGSWAGSGPVGYVAYDGTRYVITQNGTGQVQTSTNLTAWALSLLNVNSNYSTSGVVWTGSKFLIGTNTGRMASSPDGLVWTMGPDNINQNTNGWIVKDSNNIVALQQNSFQYTTNGGTTWNDAASSWAGVVGAAGNLTGAASGSYGVYAGGAWYATINSNPPSRAIILRSTSAIPTNAPDFSIVYQTPLGTNGGGYRQIVENGGTYIAVGLYQTTGSNGLISRSTNGTTWSDVFTVDGTVTGSPASFGMTGVAYGGGLWVAVSRSNTDVSCGLYISDDDGVTWTNASSAVSSIAASIMGISYLGSQFVFVTSDNKVYSLT